MTIYQNGLTKFSDPVWNMKQENGSEYTEKYSYKPWDHSLKCFSTISFGIWGRYISVTNMNAVTKNSNCGFSFPLHLQSTGLRK
jgi:hypothetical protein